MRALPDVRVAALVVLCNVSETLPSRRYARSTGPDQRRVVVARGRNSPMIKATSKIAAALRRSTGQDG
jgi:hypothetical protein